MGKVPLWKMALYRGGNLFLTYGKTKYYFRTAEKTEVPTKAHGLAKKSKSTLVQRKETVEVQFVAWLKNDASSKGSTNAYLAGLRTAEEFATKNRFKYTLLFDTSVQIALSTADELIKSPSFAKFSSDRGNYPLNAVTKYVDFLKYSFADQISSYTKKTEGELKNSSIDTNAVNRKTSIKPINPIAYSSHNLKDMFAEYLMKKYADIRVSEMFTGLAEADEFLTSFKIVTDTIFNISDFRLLAIAYESIYRDKTFRTKHKSQMRTIENAFKEYINFFKSLPIDVVKEAALNGKRLPKANEEATAASTTTQFVKDEHISPQFEMQSSKSFEPDSSANTPESNTSSEHTILDVFPDASRDYAFSKPTAFTYFGEKQEVSSWKDLLVKVCSTLCEDYPEVFDEVMGTSLINGSRFEIGNAYHYFKMTSPKAFATGKYVETNLSATDIMHRIKILLDKCAVDYENLIVSIIQQKDKAAERTKEKQTSTDNSAEHSSALKEGRVHFIDWMQNQGRQSATIFSYLSALKKVSEFCIEKGLLSTDLLLVVNVDTLSSIRAKLADLPEYRKWNIDQHNRFSAALTAYINFRAGSTSQGNNVVSNASSNRAPLIAKKEAQRDLPCNSQTAANYSAVLRTNFEDGFRAGKAIDRNRFVMYYADMFGEEPPDSDEKLVHILSKIGVLRDNRIFVKDNVTQKDLFDEIIAVTMEAFQKGASCVCIDCLYDRYSSDLASTLHIYNVTAFENEILKRTKGTFKKWHTYLQSSLRNPDPAKDIKDYLMAANFPVSYAELEENLWYIRLEKIKQTLVATPSMINVAPEKYLYAPNLPVSDKEIQQISVLIENALLQRSFISDVELTQMIEENCPSVIMNTSDYPKRGLRDVLAYLLRDKFSFRGAIISGKGEEVSMAEVFSDFCQRSEHITIDELRCFAGEMSTVIYWESVYAEMVRVSQGEFVHRDLIHFDIEQTDSVLDSLIQSTYAPIKTVNLFLHFPAIDVPWNNYVLESYVANYSRKFKLLHTSYAATDCCGAIVRQNSNIRDYRTMIVDVLSQIDSWKTKDDALQLLVDLGYQQRKSFNDIESVMQEARARMSAIRK